MRSAGAGRAIPLLRLFTLSNIVERLPLVIFKVNLEATIAFIHSGSIYTEYSCDWKHMGST